MRVSIGDNWLILKGYTTFLTYCIFSSLPKNNKSESSVINNISTKFIIMLAY